LFAVLAIGFIAAALFMIAVIRPASEDETYFEVIPY